MNNNNIDIGGLQLKVTAETKAAVTALDNLQKKIKSFNYSNEVKSTLSALSKQIRELNSALSGVDSSKARELRDTAKAINDIAKAQKNQEQAGKGAEKSASTFSEAWKKLKIGIATAGYNKLWKIGREAFQESSAYVENLNLFYVTMGKSAKTALDYAEKVNKALGIDVSDWIRNLGTFRQIGAGFGVIDSKAELMAQNLTQIGYDISSFFNIDITEAMNKVRSGFTGELEPLRNLGYALDAATLQQVAYAHGVTQSYNTMTQAQKSQLRYIAILEQSKNVMGDMARTVTSPENAVRILNQQFTQLKRELGFGLLPILQKIIPYLSAGVQLLTEWISALTGFEMPEFDYSGLNGTATIADDVQESLDGATKAAKELNAALGIDELNVISPNTGSGSGAAENGSGYDLNIDLPSYDFLAGLADQTSSLKEQMRAFFDEWGGLIKATGIAIATYFIGKKALTGWTSLKELLNAMGGSFKTLYKTSWTAATGAQKVSKSLFGAAGIIAGMGLAYSGAKNLSTALASNDKSSLAGSITSLIGGVAAGALGGAAIGGPVGALIGGLASLTAAGIGVAKAQDEMRRKMLTESIFNGVGKSIDELTEDYKRSTKAIDDYLEANNKLNDELVTQRTAFDEAAEKVNTYLNVWNETGNLDSTQFDEMTDSIRQMVTAANNLADVNFNKIFASLNGAISDYLTNDALSAIRTTRTELTALQAQVSGRVSGLGADIDRTLSLLQKEKNPTKQGALKVVLRQQLNQLAQLRNAEQTAKDNAAKEKVKSGVLSSISLGSSLSDFDTQFGNLQSTYNSQRSGIQSAYEEALLSVDILKGQADVLGISLTDKEIQAYKDSITSSYNSQLAATSSEKNKVKQQLLDAVKQAAINNVNADFVRKMTGTPYSNFILGNGDPLAPFKIVANPEAYVDTVKSKMRDDSYFKMWSFLFKLSDGRSLFDIYQKIQSFATGGHPAAGQLFIANEAGAELVGSMGNKTTVANNQQIVEGITRGVSEASSAQNELLRRQNELLLAILQKEGSVTIDGRELLKSTERAAYNRGVQFAEGGLY